MRFLRKHWKKLVVALLFAGSFAAAVAVAPIAGGSLQGEVAPSRFSEPEFRFRLSAPPNLVAAAFSPDGRLLATTGYNVHSYVEMLGPVRVWDVHSGRQLAEIPVHSGTDWYGGVGFTDDGRRLIVFEPNERLLVADPLTGKPDERVMKFIREWGDVRPFGLSPDGRFLVGQVRKAPSDEEPPLALLDLENGRKRVLPVHSDSVAFSPDSRLLASVDNDRHIVLLDAYTGQQRWRIKEPVTWPFRLSFTPDGRRLMSVNGASPPYHVPGNTIPIEVSSWDAATGARLFLSDPYESGIAAPWAYVSRDGIFCATFPDGRSRDLKVWNVMSKELKVVYRPPGSQQVHCLQCSSRGDRAAATIDARKDEGTDEGYKIALFDLRTGQTLAVVPGRNPLFSPDGQFLVVEESIETRPPPSRQHDVRVSILDAATGRVRLRLNGKGREPNHVSGASEGLLFSPSGETLVIGCSDGSLELWEMPVSQPTGKSVEVPLATLVGLLAVLAALSYRSIASRRRTRLVN